MGEPGVSIARCNRIALQQWVHMCTACPFSTIVQAPFEIHRQCAATWCISFSSWSPWDRGDSSEPFATKQKFCLKEYSNSDGNFIFQRALGLVPKQLLLFNNLWLRKDDKRNPWDMSNPCWTWQTDWCHSGELSHYEGALLNGLCSWRCCLMMCYLLMIMVFTEPL